MKSASTIPEFFEWVELIADQFTAADGFEAAWFRGVSSAKYKLIPSLYRSQAGRDEYSDDELRAEFQRRGLPFVAERPPRDHWEWYFLMQHYGAPTRLLDWTDSALVALYFAISSMRATDAEIAASKPVVWALNPWKLNTNRFYGPASPNIDDLKNYLSDDYKSHKPPRYPVAIDPNFIAQRMVVQRSHFTLHGHDVRGLDEMKTELELDDALHQIAIETDSDGIGLMRWRLALLGVSETSIFPDLAGLARELNLEYDIV